MLRRPGRPNGGVVSRSRGRAVPFLGPFRPFSGPFLRQHLQQYRQHQWPGWGGEPRAALALPSSRSLVFPFSKKKGLKCGVLGPFRPFLGPFRPFSGPFLRQHLQQYRQHQWPGWGGEPRAALALPYTRSLVFPFFSETQPKKGLKCGVLGPFRPVLGPFQALFRPFSTPAPSAIPAAPVAGVGWGAPRRTRTYL